MLIELYIEALLVDEDLADMVWEACDVGLIPDDLAALAWWSILFRNALSHRSVELTTELSLIGPVRKNLAL